MMNDFFLQLGKNRIFVTVVFTWLVTQSSKVLLGIIKERRFNFQWFIGAGGMPSSHAASVAALATAVGLTFGFNTALFAITLVFAFIIMLDAQGVRRASGKQAETLNKIMDDVYRKKGINEDRLKELLGHTPVEVLAGASIGILMAICFHQ